MAVDLNLFSLVNHVLKLFLSNADKRLLHPLLIAVAVEIHRRLIKNFQAKLS